jgi:hypothetical protein
MRSYLTDPVDRDYASFRVTPPSPIPSHKYVVQGKQGLALLRTQHNLSEVLVTSSRTKVEAQCNYAILRFHPEFDGSRDQFFHSDGQYRFTTVRIGRLWRISSIEQRLTMSEGNPSRHGAVRNHSRR